MRVYIKKSNGTTASAELTTNVNLLEGAKAFKVEKEGVRYYGKLLPNNEGIGLRVAIGGVTYGLQATIAYKNTIAFDAVSPDDRSYSVGYRPAGTYKVSFNYAGATSTKSLTIPSGTYSIIVRRKSIAVGDNNYDYYATMDLRNGTNSVGGLEGPKKSNPKDLKGTITIERTA